MKEANDTFEREIKLLNSEAIYPLNLFKRALRQSAIFIFSSRKVNLDHPLFMDFVEGLTDYAHDINDLSLNSTITYPLLNSCCYKDCSRTSINQLGNLSKIHLEILKEKKEEMIIGEPKDWIEILYQAFSPKYTDEQVINIYITTILDTMEELSIILTNSIIRLLNHPEIQDECHKLLDKVVGEYRPSLDDRPNLALIEGVFLETQRMYDMQAISSLYSCHKEFKFMRYDIPKDSTILIAPNDILFDEELFPEPEVFNPRRFVNKSGRGINYKPSEFIRLDLGKFTQ